MCAHFNAFSGEKEDYKFPSSTVQFKFKTDTDLYELTRCKTHALSLTVSPNGKLFACTAPDRRVRVFHFLTGKKSRVFDESLEVHLIRPRFAFFCGIIKKTRFSTAEKRV